jgi:serine/threonine protein kinase
LAASSEQEKSLKEIGILRELSNDPDTAEVYAVRLLDDFYHAGPNGHHQCLVFELLGPSIDNVINSCNPLNGEPRTADDGIDPRVVLRVSRQLLVALGILHKRSIAHGGRIVQTLLRP